MTYSQEAGNANDAFSWMADGAGGLSMAEANILSGVAKAGVDLAWAFVEFKRAENELIMKLAMRDLILKAFDSTEKFMHKLFKERKRLLKEATRLMRRGARRKDPVCIVTGYEIIKLVLSANPAAACAEFIQAFVQQQASY